MEASLEPLLDYAIKIVLPLLGVVAMAGIKALASKLGVERDAQIIQSIRGEVDDAVAYAKKRAEKEAEGVSVDLGNDSIDMVVNQVVSQFPKWMRKLKYGPADIRKMVEARL
jgi:hypothetical protein